MGRANNRFPYISRFFVSTDISVAAAYAEDRGGPVYSFRYQPQRTATSEIVIRLANRLGIDVEEAPVYELLSPNVRHDAARVIKALQSEGYDSVEFWDFAPNDNFKEVPAIAVLSPGVLSDPVVL